MKQTIVIVCLLTILLTTSAYATQEQPTREDVLEDAVIELLQPPMYQAVQKQFGTTSGIAFQCLKVVNIKKPDPGSWIFEVTMEGMTYSGAHNPPHYIFTVKIIKDRKTEGKWVMKEYNVRKLEPNEKIQCRRPV